MSKNAERWKKDAKEILKDHQFKRLASWGTGNEVWECSRQGSSVYAFTICITRMGIAVIGDIDALAFRVGSAYGLEFLAGEDVDYYIHSKLEADCRKNELDRDALTFTVTERIMAFLFDGMGDEDVEVVEKVLGNKLPETVFNSHEAAMMPSDCQELVSLLAEKREELATAYLEAGYDSPPQWITQEHATECLELIEKAERVSSLEEGYQLLSDFDLFYFEMIDVDIDKPAENLMARLYLVNEAARQIVALKREQAEQAQARALDELKLGATYRDQSGWEMVPIAKEHGQAVCRAVDEETGRAGTVTRAAESLTFVSDAPGA